MGAHSYRPYAGTAATVRDAERLVQVQVADVRTELAGPRESDQRVQVRAVDVDLAAVVVHERAHVADGLFVNAVGGRVGDHQRGEVVGVLLDLHFEIGEVDVASLVAGHDHDAKAGHDR